MTGGNLFGIQLAQAHNHTRARYTFPVAIALSISCMPMRRYGIPHTIRWMERTGAPMGGANKGNEHLYMEHFGTNLVFVVRKIIYYIVLFNFFVTMLYELGCVHLDK